MPLKVLIVEDFIYSNILSPRLPECKLMDHFMHAFILCMCEIFSAPTYLNCGV